MTSDHLRFMRVALALGRRHLGQTWPNPSVGAVLVKDGRIVGIGSTARGGRPHAETQAIAQAGSHTKGSTLYVSLEPCAHHGKTPPCTKAIIGAGIARAVVACRDPHREVNGNGVAQLAKAGIDIIEGIGAEEARDINRGFFSVVEKKRPFVALKIASSADGKIAGGKNRWITGEAARDYVQLLRSQHDAILTGIGTVLADDPLLTCRLSGLEDKSPVRVVLDRKRRLPKKSNLANTSKDIPVWALDLPDVKSVLAHLAEKGITRVMVEAGQQLNTAFLESGLVDRIYWFRAPEAIGSAGLSAFADPALNAPSALAGWRQVEHITLPPDTLDIVDHV